jgi:outer membrane protein assembly factor BamB
MVFSVSENKTIFKYNFYKKKNKNIDKHLNLIIEKNIIYISDNLGFIYALDIKKKNILWAKNYKIPFRSNTKITSNKIILANQNNSIYFLNKSNGELLSTIPTEESSIKQDFINNFSLNKDTLLFLNTYGSLYSLNINTMRINWFINLNQSIDINPSNLFKSNQIIISKNKVFVPTNENFYVLDLSNGSIIFKKDFSSILKPLILNNIFIAVENDLLIATDLNSGKIIFSYDINQKISKFLNTKKKKVELKRLMFADNKIFIFLKNSYVVKFNLNGTVDSINKLPEKINSYPIIIDSSLVYLNKKNEIIVVN